MPIRDDIQYIPGNTRGSDYVVGDIHGCATELQQLLMGLEADDRLFIVGDLFDRGPNSLAVYEAVKDDSRVNVVRGNHEDVFVSCMDINLESMVSELENIISGQIKTFSNRDASIQAAALWRFFVGGGSWVFKNRGADLIILNPNVMSISSFARYLPYLKEGFIPEVAAIRDYLAQLPYILSVSAAVNPLVGDVPPFLICHADLPLTDEELADGPKFLTPDQIIYVTHARERDFIVRRTESSTVCYCGHSPHVSGGAVVRPKTNMCNLDTGAYSNSVLMRVNHTQRLVEPIVGNDFSGAWKFMSACRRLEDTEENRIQFDCERKWYLDGPVWLIIQDYLRAKYPPTSLAKPIECNALEDDIVEDDDDSIQRKSRRMY